MTFVETRLATAEALAMHMSNAFATNRRLRATSWWRRRRRRQLRIALAGHCAAADVCREQLNGEPGVRLVSVIDAVERGVVR